MGPPPPSTPVHGLQRGQLGCLRGYDFELPCPSVALSVTAGPTALQAMENSCKRTETMPAPQLQVGLRLRAGPLPALAATCKLIVHLNPVTLMQAVMAVMTLQSHV